MPVRGGVRVVSDDEGQRWRVFERATADGSPTLVFESDRAWRRVREYPQNWRELPARELMQLSWRR